MCYGTVPLGLFVEQLRKQQGRSPLLCQNRTIQFQSSVYSCTKATVFIDEISPMLNYALYVERVDLLALLLAKIDTELNKTENMQNREFRKQPVYPSTFLTHLLIDKLKISTSFIEEILQYGKGFGIYERIATEWDNNFCDIEDGYWNSLCEYHLNGIGVTGSKWKDEEFLWFGLIPMELINIFKVRQKLGLDVPVIKHELFATPMAVYPKIPTGYSPELDVKFQLIERTKKDIQRYTYEDIINQLKHEHGVDAALFY